MILRELNSDINGHSFERGLGKGLVKVREILLLGSFREYADWELLNARCLWCTVKLLP